MKLRLVELRHWIFPPSHSEHGPAIDAQVLLAFLVCLVVFVLVHVLLGLAVLRRRRRGMVGPRRWWLGELVYGVLVTGVLLTLSVAGQRVYRDVRNPPDFAERDEPLRILVVGQQFKFHVVYPGPDNRLGRYLAAVHPTDLRWPDPRPAARRSTPFRFRNTLGPAELPINDARDAIEAYQSIFNPLLKDFDDPAGEDDLWENALARPLILPLGRDVEIHLASLDVIHGFFIPQMRIKLDIIPGVGGIVRLRPSRLTPPEGIELLCTEYCGQGHFTMRHVVHVVPAEQWEQAVREVAGR